MKVAVVGAGVVGLSSAVCIQREVPDAQVTVIADQFSPDLTSNVAGGVLLLHATGDTSVHLLRKWAAATKHHLLELLQRPDAGTAGIQLMSGWHVWNKPAPEMYDKDMFVEFHQMSAQELAMFPGCQSGSGYTTVQAQGDLYLPYLTKIIWKNGGKLIMKKVKSLEELVEDYDIIVNCTGTGARELTGDQLVQPVRGQLIRVEAPWVKNFMILNDGEFSILPGIGFVCLGGTHQKGRWDRKPDRRDTHRILTGTYKLMPSLKNAPVLKELVGLRPFRTSVRLERRTIQKGHRRVPVIHNYGHGGAGITLHWGCAQDVAKMIKESRPDQYRSKL